MFPQNFGANLKWQLHYMTYVYAPMQAYITYIIYDLDSRQCLTQTTMFVHQNDYVVLDLIYNSL